MRSGSISLVDELWLGLIKARDHRVSVIALHRTNKGLRVCALGFEFRGELLSKNRAHHAPCYRGGEAPGFVVSVT